jgi:hypothetical protein
MCEGTSCSDSGSNSSVLGFDIDHDIPNSSSTSTSRTEKTETKETVMSKIGFLVIQLTDKLRIPHSNVSYVHGNNIPV